MDHIITPVIFIHGLWLHATSWGPWVKLFRRLGYQPVAPGWPGEDTNIHEARLLPERVAGFSINDITDHFAMIARDFEVKPVVIGHSFGGLVALKLLGQGVASAAAAISPVQPKGVWQLPPQQLRSAWPAFKNPFAIDRAVALTAYDFRHSFGNALTLEESTELYTQWAIPSPARPLFEVAFANILPRAQNTVARPEGGRGPLLLIAGGKDRTVPASVVRSTYKALGKSGDTIELKEFADRGHSLVIDEGWREVADHVVGWLKEVLPEAVAPDRDKKEKPKRED